MRNEIIRGIGGDLCDNLIILYAHVTSYLIALGSMKPNPNEELASIEAFSYGLQIPRNTEPTQGRRTDVLAVGRDQLRVQPNNCSRTSQKWGTELANILNDVCEEEEQLQTMLRPTKACKCLLKSSLYYIYRS
ncbi:hypothetical protein RB195_010834 [Necator americanus]|uniref:Uncharacterized protein n=1 Tax=Necator americanus TaxID=51031 RepID=A0ABR1CZP0_NECAM